jgi:hypothetical protein
LQKILKGILYREEVNKMQAENTGKNKPNQENRLADEE